MVACGGNFFMLSFCFCLAVPPDRLGFLPSAVHFSGICCLLDPNLDPVRARRAFSHLDEHRLAAPFFFCVYFACGSQPCAAGSRIVNVLIA